MDRVCITCMNRTCTMASLGGTDWKPLILAISREGSTSFNTVVACLKTYWWVDNRHQPQTKAKIGSFTFQPTCSILLQIAPSSSRNSLSITFPVQSANGGCFQFLFFFLLKKKDPERSHKELQQTSVAFMFSRSGGFSLRFSTWKVFLHSVF